jgi:predicted RNase H-like HicB family nuclease
MRSSKASPTCRSKSYGCLEHTFATSIKSLPERVLNVGYWSDEDQVFVAEIPELPGCMAHGDTQEATLANAKEAIQLWIETAEEFGDPVPEPKGRRLMLA